MTCVCPICQRHREWDAKLGDLSPQSRKVVEEIYVALANAEDEACYWQMKFEGTWPDGEARK
jgi:hypothetical protein